MLGKFVFRVLFFIYKTVFSPLIHFVSGPGMGCRFEPTCSEYAAQAFDRLSFGKAVILIMKRLGRCHPFCRAESGYDPVPYAIANSDKKSLGR